MGPQYVVLDRAVSSATITSDYDVSIEQRVQNRSHTILNIRGTRSGDLAPVILADAPAREVALPAGQVSGS